ncbi:cytochrome c oxidase assembly protein [Pseudonocardia sp. RS010]|uniref:cytochrome c oxidase assembly protein n=1 Tax=Pseudonocardia sp. RS010 TaxID=3385979 RepID=UPI00399FB232
MSARIWAGIGATALATALLLAVWAPSLSQIYGYADLGPVVNAGLPLAQLVALGAAAVMVGNLLLAAVFVPGEPHGSVSPTGYTALLAARPAGVLLALAAFAVAALTAAETAGVDPVAYLTRPDLLAAGLSAVEPAAGWAVLAVVATVVALASRLVLSWRGAVGLLLVLLAGLAVPPMTSVGNAEEAHDWSGDAATLHSLAALLWLGSTIAVVLPASGREATPSLLRRHHTIATGALVVVTGSAVVPSLLALRPQQILTTGYGLLVMASVVVTALLAFAGVRLRRRCGRGGAGRTAAVELVLLGLAAAAGAAMSRLVPPADDGANASRLVFFLGYELPGHMSVADLALRWRIDLIYAPLSLAAATAYLWGVARLWRRGRVWPWTHTAAWLAGCTTVLLATSSGIGTYATGVLSMHLLAHALLSAIAPVLLVLGHGLSLLREASPQLGARFDALLDSTPLRAARHPAIAWCLVAVTLFGLYATGLFGAIVLDHWSHPVMDAVTLATGLLLFWILLGRQPGNAGLPALGRLAMTFAVMVLHAGFAIWLLSRSTPIAPTFYGALQLPFIPNPIADQRRGAVLTWVVAELAMIAAVAVLARRWSRAAHPDGSPRHRPRGR